MDPIGFSLENFDAVGKWRTRDGSTAIDASGQLTDGTRVDGPRALRDGLMHYSDQFVRTMTEKLLTYSLGRGLQYQDMPIVRSIVARPPATTTISLGDSRHRQEFTVSDENESAIVSNAEPHD